jgi:4-amino-4-deoxy-L-arabinose transferase-like glycosyltransferase
VAEREWREAVDMRPSTLGLVVVLAAAAVLRLWGIGQGIPYAVGVDEPEIIERAVRMMKTGDFNPHFFDYPGLYIYVQVVIGCLSFIAQAIFRGIYALNAVGADDFYLWGRISTAVLGTLTVYVVYQIGLRWGARHALLAAALLAVMPNHVRESHFVLTDVPLTFLMALAFLLSLRALEKGTPRAFALAGAVTGLAAATKYYGAVSVLLPLLAAYLNHGGDRSRLRCGLVALGAAVAAFLAGAPFTLLDLPSFLNGFAGVMGANQVTKDMWGGWVTSLKHLRLGLGWPGLLLALAGSGLAVVRVFTGPGRARFGLAVMLLAVYLPLITSRETVWARYLLPVVPVICLLAAIAVVSGVSLLRRFSIPRWARTSMIVALTVAALLPPAVSSIQWVRVNARVSTQAVAYAWVIANIPDGARVALETRGLLLPEHQYRVRYFKTLSQNELEVFANEGYDYLVASSVAFGRALSDPQLMPEQYAAYRRLFKGAALVFTVQPSTSRPGPELRIYKIAH